MGASPQRNSWGVYRRHRLSDGFHSFSSAFPQWQSEMTNDNPNGTNNNNIINTNSNNLNNNSQSFFYENYNNINRHCSITETNFIKLDNSKRSPHRDSYGSLE